MQEIGIKKADFRTYTLRKEDNMIARSNPSLGYATSVKNKGMKFTFNKSFFVDDAAFLFLLRDDIEKGAKLVSNHFRKFGLTVHCGNKLTKADSKTEAMFFPGAGKTNDDKNATMTTTTNDERQRRQQHDDDNDNKHRRYYDWRQQLFFLL